MGKRSGSPDTVEQAARLSGADLDKRLASAKWRLGYARNSVLRSLARKHLALLQAAKARRQP